MVDFAWTRPLDIGEMLTQSEVEQAFDTDFGYQFRGITYRSPDEGKYIILLINEGEIYDDELGRDGGFTYEGEGVPKKGDQQLTVSNQALIDAIDDLIPVYLFMSEEGIDQYEYQGLVEVKDCRYVSDGERMVYRFDMRKLGVRSWQDVLDEQREIENRSHGEPPLTENRADHIETKARTRSSIFSQQIKEMYNFTCAVCGARRVSPQGHPEVEAAHIYPKYENGADDLRNGIALCRFHHWAFDHGWFALTDELELKVNRQTDQDPPGKIVEFENESAIQPRNEEFTPHSIYLSAHRSLHGFE